MALPPPPPRAFASDNAAGAHPAVIEAVQRANTGHALAYGDDDETTRCEHAFRELFDHDVTTLLTFNGTGANITALAALTHPGEAVVCSDWAHISVDETGAPERVLGVKLLDIPSGDGKLTPDGLRAQQHAIGVQHHSQPVAVSITQSTELGTVYTTDEVSALCETAHSMGMRVHVDGARIANAVAALGNDRAALRAMTVEAGVDVMSFGGTKNGLLGGEAVVFFDPKLAARAPYIRKSVTQLPSKMRFIASQFTAVLAHDLWLGLAQHANAMGAALYDETSAIDGVTFDTRPVVNSVFPRLPVAAIDPLREWSFFWDWDHERHQVRWMTAWDTTEADVHAFSAGVREIVAGCN